MSESKMRVEIPQNPKELLTLAISIFEKHQTDGASSPLRLIADYKWDAEGPKLTQAMAKHDEAERYRKSMETAYRERDLLMTDTTYIVRATRDLLTGINSENMKRLAEWGFSVEASVAPKTKSNGTKTKTT